MSTRWQPCLAATFAFWVLTVCVGCTTYTVRIPGGGGSPTIYEPPDNPGRVTGIGIESQDIVSATDKMVRDILASPVIIRRSSAARIVVDAEYFEVQGTENINKSLFTNRLRVELHRAAAGKLVILARHRADMTERERDLERHGVVTGGTGGPTKDALGYDYRLEGTIANRDTFDARTRTHSRYTQITFSLIERGSTVTAWTCMYEFRKSGANSIIH